MPQQRGLIDPNLYTRYELKRRRNVAAVILEQNPGDGRKPSPGWEKSLIAVQKKQDDPTCIAGSRAAARESRKRFGKTDHPARPSLCARHADNDISFILKCFFTGVTILCDEVPR